MLALDAIFTDNERHTNTSLISGRRILVEAGFENSSGRVFKILFQLIKAGQCLASRHIV
jgi:hypothetical protein